MTCVVFYGLFVSFIAPEIWIAGLTFVFARNHLTFKISYFWPLKWTIETIFYFYVSFCIIKGVLPWLILPFSSHSFQMQIRGRGCYASTSDVRHFICSTSRYRRQFECRSQGVPRRDRAHNYRTPFLVDLSVTSFDTGLFTLWRCQRSFLVFFGPSF
jgi:hypothetical protein